MQRTLALLVLLLTAVVAVLAVMVWSLYGELDGRTDRRPGGSAYRPPPVEPEIPAIDPERFAALERRLMEEESARKRLEGTIRYLERLAARKNTDEPSDPEAVGNGDGSLPGEPGWDREYERDPDGGLVVTAEDEEFFVAVQQRVERRRRIDGMTRNLMRRVDLLVQNGSLAPLSEEARGKVEQVLTRYAREGDDLVTRFVRDPTREVLAMTSEQRRDEMAAQRDRIAMEAQKNIDEVLGPVDGAKVGERTLQSSWGTRRRLDPRRLSPPRND